MTELSKAGVLIEFNDSIRIFRTDLLTSKSCGNKQFKLTSNLQQLKQSGVGRVLTFGGLWSNHLHAFAIACEDQGLEAVAVVRGEPTQDSLLLNNAIKHGLKVSYVSRSDYRKRHDEDYVDELLHKLDCDAHLPEGGSNAIAVTACAEISSLVIACCGRPPAILALAVGTGATMAGVVNGALAGQKVIGVPVVQDRQVKSCISEWVCPHSKAEWMLSQPADPPRYGKVDQALLEFVLQTYHDTGVILDPVYNAKALRSLLKFRGFDHAGEDCVFIHTGGLGGCLGFADELMRVDGPIAAQLLGEVKQILGFAD